MIPVKDDISRPIGPAKSFFGKEFVRRCITDHQAFAVLGDNRPPFFPGNCYDQLLWITENQEPRRQISHVPACQTPLINARVETIGLFDKEIGIPKIPGTGLVVGGEKARGKHPRQKHYNRILERWIFHDRI
jgi:hypothetical protein